MTRLRKIMIINKDESVVQYHFRESDSRLLIDKIKGVKFKLTPSSQLEAGLIVDKLFMEVINEKAN